nr:hypothetical protein [Blastococcus sp. MG754426]
MKSTNAKSATASTTLAVESHLIPRLMPDSAEIRNRTVTTAMIASCTPEPMAMPSLSEFSPPLICAAPRPSEVATPNTVATTATVSTAVPSGPSTRSPRTGRSAPLMVAFQPRRNRA